MVCREAPLKRRWKVVLVSAAIGILGLYGLRLWVNDRAVRGYSVDRATLNISTFTLDFLRKAARDGLEDLLHTSGRQPLLDRMDAACLSLKMTRYDGAPYCPSITLLENGTAGIFLYSDGSDLLVTEALVTACGADEAMLQGLIAHELGHSARLRDGPDYQYWSQSKRRIVAQTHGTARFGLQFEDFEAAAEQIRANPQGLIDYAFTPVEEARTRAHARGLLKEAGLPADGFDRFLKCLHENPDIPGAARFLTTHPDP